MFIDGLRNQIPQSEHESREKVPQVTLNPGSSYCEECFAFTAHYGSPFLF